MSKYKVGQKIYWKRHFRRDGLSDFNEARTAVIESIGFGVYGTVYHCSDTQNRNRKVSVLESWIMGGA